MNFLSAKYTLFLALVLLLYWQLGRREQNLLILLASCVFYGFWDWRLLGLIAISTASNFYCGKFISESKSDDRRKLYLWLAVLINIGMLGWFKYASFFAHSLNSLLVAIGFQSNEFTLKVILPVGISFYVFHSLSYSIDIYRKELTPTDSLVEFSAFVTFFPQMVAGPIVRAKELLFQLRQDRTLSAFDVQTGIGMLILGVFMKGVVADNLAIELVDPVFASPSQFSRNALWGALIGYSFQIYADFYGYTMIATGSARLMGIKLPRNFAFPYLATSFSDFWQRWHISMSRFFRDYVYLPLGGNRSSLPRTIGNIAITNLISGLWHGASWTFVAWGFQHAALNAINQVLRKLLSGLREETRRACLTISVIPRWLVVQLAILLTWVVFRCSDFSSASDFYSGLFQPHGGKDIAYSKICMLCFSAVILDHGFGWIRENIGRYRIPSIYFPIAYSAMIILTFNLVPKLSTPFIYFQF